MKQLRTIACLFLSVMALAGTANKMSPRLYFGNDSLGAVRVGGNEIIVDFNAGGLVNDPCHKDLRFKVVEGNVSAVVTVEDAAASTKWMKKNNQKSRLSLRNGDLYLDGNVIDMNGAEVTEIYEALPWDRGILCIGRTYRKKAKERTRTVKDLFQVSPEDIEPYCAVWINPATHRGSYRWLYGKVRRSLLVFPLPRN